MNYFRKNFMRKEKKTINIFKNAVKTFLKQFINNCHKIIVNMIQKLILIPNWFAL